MYFLELYCVARTTRLLGVIPDSEIRYTTQPNPIRLRHYCYALPR